MLYVCPNDKCQFRTYHAKSMQKHQANTGHGRIPKNRVYRGHVTTQSKSKKSESKK